MIRLLLLVVYVAGVIVTWQSFAMAMLTSLEKEVPTAGLSNESRAVAAFVGMCQAIVWPASIPIRFLFRLFVRSGVLQTDNEKRLKEKKELEAYRRMAKDHNLPAPEVDI